VNEELKKEFERLEAALGKNAEALKALDTLRAQATAREADVKEIREKMALIEKANEERGRAITDMQQRLRTERLDADPAGNRRRAVELFGMMGRQLFCRHANIAVPRRYAAEAAQVEAYRAQRATVEESTGGGAYFIPTMLEQDILDTLEEVSPILSLVDLAVGMPTKGTMPTLTSRPSLQPKRASSDTAMSQSDFGFSQMTWDTDEAYLFFPVDNWLLELSPFALGSRLIPLTREAFLDGLAKWVILADGTASYNSDTGILNETTYVSTMAAGKKAFGDVDNPSLVKALQAMLVRGRGPRCRWVMSLYVLGILEELNRTGKVPVISYGTGDEVYCKRRPVVIDENFPDEADDGAAKVVLGVGDLAAYLVVVAASGIQIASSTEYLFGKNQTCFRATGHIDVVRKPVNNFRLLKTAAA